MSNLSFSRRRQGGSPFKSPTAFQLRALVLDYLCHECFTNTARAFLHDSTVKELDADGDEVLSSTEASLSSSSLSNETSAESHQTILANVQQRREIRELILTGRIDDAIGLLNEYFPAVLSDESPTPPPPSLEDEDEPFTFVSETSMIPAHLLLNLRTQAFIEACRTRPLEIPPDKTFTQLSDLSNSTTGSPMDISDDSAPPLHASPHSHPSEPPQYGDITPARLASLLHKGKKLYTLAATLPNYSKDKGVYEKELANVGGLLAYPVPEDSPVSKYLSYERRDALAEQVNRAILYRSGQSPITAMEILTRYTTALWGAARLHGVKVRSGACIPPTSKSPTVVATGRKPEDIVNEAVPAFDLKQFLDYKS